MLHIRAEVEFLFSRGFAEIWSDTTLNVYFSCQNFHFLYKIQMRDCREYGNVGNRPTTRSGTIFPFSGVYHVTFFRSLGNTILHIVDLG